MFLFPFFVGGLAESLLSSTLKQPKIHGRVVLFLIVGVFMVSSCRQRWLRSYEKDPFRSAVAYLRHRSEHYQELPIVWVGSKRALSYYGGVSLETWEESSRRHVQGTLKFVFGGGWSGEDIRRWSLRFPEYLVLLHRPDKLDIDGHWRNLIASAGEITLAWQRGNIRVYHVKEGQRLTP